MKDSFKTFPKLVADPTTNEQNIIAWKNRVEKELREDIMVQEQRAKHKHEYVKGHADGMARRDKEILG